MAEQLDTSNLEESLLLERLNRIENNPAGYFVVHLHLSQLRSSNRQNHFLNIARRTFDNLINSAEALLFSFVNSDLVLLCREVMIQDIDP